MEKTFKLQELDCANCAAKMQEAISKIPGVQSATVNFMTQKLILAADEQDWSRILNDVHAAIRKILPRCKLVTKETSPMTREQEIVLIRILVSAVLLAVALVFFPEGSIPRWVILMLAYFTMSYDVLKEAGGNILRGQVFDENFLMSIASIGAIVIGEYPEAVAVMLFYQVGELFQSYSVQKSRKSISSLMDIRPDTADVEREGQLLTVSPEDVHVGEAIVVKAGERVPLDGIILEGTSTLNTSALTGESLPRDVTVHDEVISGCINQSGLLRVKVTKPYGESTVAKILDLVENASDKKSRVESFITRFARVYTPVVVVAAVLLFLAPSLVTGDWLNWGTRALSFLVVSCPCALVISVPLSFFGGIGAASKRGILFKGSNYLVARSKADIVVLDKTGTLTHGVFHVTVIHPDEISQQELLRITATVESYSDHPISRSIRAHFRGPVDKETLSDVQEIAGQGISAVMEGHTIYAGNDKLMGAIHVALPDCPHIGTVVHVARDHHYLGHIVISDEIKEGSAAAIQDLRQEGVRQTVMLTGDSQAVADDVAVKLGLDQVFAGLLPAQKVEHVETLLTQKVRGGQLLFVGDGINDAPVLTRADVGIAMGAMGSDAAVEAADVVLMDDNPTKLPLAIQIARKTMGIAQQNIIFALGVKALVLILAAAGIAGLWMAVFADVGVSLLAVLNAMRAMRIAKSK